MHNFIIECIYIYINHKDIDQLEIYIAYLKNTYIKVINYVKAPPTLILG